MLGSPVHKLIKISKKVAQKIIKSCSKNALFFEKLLVFKERLLVQLLFEFVFVVFTKWEQVFLKSSHSHELVTDNYIKMR